jgi:hypothetical protein
MPRKDPTFTDADLIRFYCANLDPAEKTRVRKRFRANILHRTPICPNEEGGDDYCAWAKAFDQVVQICRGIGDALPEILVVLGGIEIALSVLSWAGWLGKLLLFFRLIILALINVVVYVGAILIVVGELAPFSSWISRQFCKQVDDDSIDDTVSGEPPDPDTLPPNPASKLVDDIQQASRDFYDWITTPPDWIDDILP